MILYVSILIFGNKTHQILILITFARNITIQRSVRLYSCSGVKLENSINLSTKRLKQPDRINFTHLLTNSKKRKNWIRRMKNEFLQTEEAIVAMLKTVYDPEIPVNVYDLGLIYKIDVDDEKNVKIDMTLTAPNCPAADFLLEDIRMKVASIDDVKNVEVNLVFEPEWDKDMMSEEAKLELGFL